MVVDSRLGQDTTHQYPILPLRTRIDGQMLNYSSNVIASQQHVDSHDFIRPQTFPRHSTEPRAFHEMEHHPRLPDRRVQTGFNVQKPCNSRHSQSPITKFWHRFQGRRDSKSKSFPNAHCYSRQSTMDTKNSASFEQTRPWDQKAILSLDGGGIRGYSALLIMQELMEKIRQVEERWPDGDYPWDGPAHSSYHPVDPVGAKSTDSPDGSGHLGDMPKTCKSSMYLPCHYFDYMAGTSTGGLIGIMLGRLRMNVKDCIAEYETLGGEVFGKSRWFHIRSIPPFWLPREKYNHRTLEAVIQSLVDRRIPKIGGFPGGKTFAFDEDRCRVVVVAYQENEGSGTEKTYLFRTYKNLKKAPDELDRNPGPAHDIPILEVARATSAAPGYFKEVKIDKLKYLDGGFGANNPCLEMFREVDNLNNYDERCIGCVLSLGTGKNDEKRIQSKTGFKEAFRSKFIHYENFARKWASDSEGPHSTMVGIHEKSNGAFKYFRLNVDDGLAHMKLDEWHCRGSTRKRFGRLVGWVNLKRSPRPSSSTDNVHDEKLADDADSYSDHHSATQLTHQDDNLSDHDSLFAHIPAFFRPHNCTLATIRTQTHDYLARPDCQDWLQQCAEYLVASRRSRVKADIGRWQRTCFNTWYQCQVRGCQRGQKEYADARALEKHLLDKHPSEFSKADEEGKRKLDETVRMYQIMVH